MLRYVFHLEYFLDLLFPPRDTQLFVRAATLESVCRHLAPRTVRMNDASAISLLPYREPLMQALITEAKYENNRKAQQLLGTLLARYLQDHIKVWATSAQQQGKIVIVPLPLGIKRRKERGYNQTEEIARFAQNSFTQSAPPNISSRVILMPGALIRTRDTAAQTSLGRDARLTNMQGAFALSSSIEALDPSYSYMLFDDVLTTGATLAAAHKALQDAGAKSIILLTLAH